MLESSSMQHPNLHANYISVLRHTCSAKDGMAGWGWTSYDSRTGGSQTMHDVGNGLDLTTEFVKTNSKDNAGNWALRISGTPRKNERAGIKTEVVFYVGMEGMQNCFNCELVAAAEEQGSGNNKFIENPPSRIGECNDTHTESEGTGERSEEASNSRASIHGSEEHQCDRGYTLAIES